MVDTKEASHLHSNACHLENMTEADECGAASVPDLKPSIEEQDANNSQVGHSSIKPFVQAEP